MKKLINEVHLADCYDVIKKIPSNSVDLIITDPPYDIEVSGGSKMSTQKRINRTKLKFISNGFDYAIFDEFVRVLKKINIYIFCSKKQFLPILKYFVEGQGCYLNLISWHKLNPVPTCGNTYMPDTEYCLHFRYPGVKIYGTPATKMNLTPTNQKDKAEYKHPTVKPLKIIRNFIINSSLKGDVILDPFAGTGTTAVAAKELERGYIAIEKEKEYYDIMLKRLKEVSKYSTVFNNHEQMRLF